MLWDFFKRRQLKKYWFLNSSLKSLLTKTIMSSFPGISQFLDHKCSVRRLTVWVINYPFVRDVVKISNTLHGNSSCKTFLIILWTLQYSEGKSFTLFFNISMSKSSVNNENWGKKMKSKHTPLEYFVCILRL